ncbi:MAG: pilus assembly protein PilP [Pseudomonadales bacterium]|uniref:Type 4 fimbrial biogenesis protein PilP n=1 Tax=Oleiphilus messinensis TaxID=141451 RepID=A0A1Y0I3R4_9GAMM|nr:pilus assembly protein PilP [Oleiphilus messinensis]ARU54880.1 type 4 fimbrial biogenesis protein PilP [Oleiphilus messinensis]MCG8611084.1 pilus assembly protein PilP [Pseudomonadales bacterium]
MVRHELAIVLPLVMLALQGCSAGRGFSDIDQFMAEMQSKPRGKIEQLPVFEAYEAFTYSAANRRAPFSVPVDIQLLERQLQENSTVTPDLDRPKELLENYAIASLKLVGTLKRADSGPLFALIQDDEGGIHRVQEGQYMGKNHGRVIRVDDAGMQLVEIVPNGRGGWLERPRTLALIESGEG